MIRLLVALALLIGFVAPASARDFELVSLKLVEGPKTASACDKYWRIRVYTKDSAVLHIEGGTLLKADFKPDVGAFNKKFRSMDAGGGSSEYELFGDTTNRSIGIRSAMCEWTAAYQ